MAKITRIEPNIPRKHERKKVAAYARVSMETELLHHSLSTQVSYFSSLIQSNPEWEYAGVYADEGITGTAIKNRDEFKRLIKDCEAGKIDIVLVKSVSRFARDTVDTLNTTRHLKDLGVDVYFEKENIHSISKEGELLLTLLASFAQAEAESISANEKWSVQKHFEKGESNTGILSYGYDWNSETKTMMINEEEAKWVRYIYEQYLAGKSIKALATEMKEKGVCGNRGNPLSRSTIRRILTSEHYVGDLLLQKYYNPTVHNVKRNNGEVEQILITDDHEPIVSREDFAKVQERLQHRARTADNYGYQKTFFAGLVKCGKCGYACNRVQTHGSTKGQPYIECNHRKIGECKMLPINENLLKEIMENEVGDRDKVEQITLFDDHIDFLLKDDTIKTHIREYVPNGYYQSPFSRNIDCGHCGSTVVRMSNHGRPAWFCNEKKHNRLACDCKYVREPELYEAATWAVGTTENLLMQLYLKIDRTVIYTDKIEFYMKEGGVKTWQRQ